MLPIVATDIRDNGRKPADVGRETAIPQMSMKRHVRMKLRHLKDECTALIPLLIFHFN